MNTPLPRITEQKKKGKNEKEVYNENVRLVLYMVWNDEAEKTKRSLTQNFMHYLGMKK